jgi:hypothetical protein
MRPDFSEQRVLADQFQRNGVVLGQWRSEWRHQVPSRGVAILRHPALARTAIACRSKSTRPSRVAGIKPHRRLRSVRLKPASTIMPAPKKMQNEAIAMLNVNMSLGELNGQVSEMRRMYNTTPPSTLLTKILGSFGHTCEKASRNTSASHLPLRVR